MKKTLFYSSFLFLSLLMIFLYAGCDTTSTEADNLDLSSYGTRTIADAADTLTLDTVKILIQDIKLNVANSSDSTNFKVGPFVYFLNFNTNVNLMTTAYIPQGNYDKIKFEIHKLNDNETPPDPEFVDNNGRYSTVVKGWFNGAYFIYKSTASVHQKLNFPTSIYPTQDARTNITLKAEPYKWFYKNGVLLDPNNPANVNDIDNNIKNNVNDNLKAFRDNDRNGIPD